MNDDEQNNSNEKPNPLTSAQKRRKPFTRMIDVSDQFMYETFEMGADLSGDEQRIQPSNLTARPEEPPEATSTSSGLSSLLSAEHDQASEGEEEESPQVTTFSSLLQATGEFQKPTKIEKAPGAQPAEPPANTSNGGLGSMLGAPPKPSAPASGLGSMLGAPPAIAPQSAAPPPPPAPPSAPSPPSGFGQQPLNQPAGLFPQQPASPLPVLPKYVPQPKPSQPAPSAGSSAPAKPAPAAPAPARPAASPGAPAQRPPSGAPPASSVPQPPAGMTGGAPPKLAPFLQEPSGGMPPAPAPPQAPLLFQPGQSNQALPAQTQGVPDSRPAPTPPAPSLPSPFSSAQQIPAFSPQPPAQSNQGMPAQPSPFAPPAQSNQGMPAQPSPFAPPAQSNQGRPAQPSPFAPPAQSNQGMPAQRSPFAPESPFQPASSVQDPAETTFRTPPEPPAPPHSGRPPEPANKPAGLLGALQSKAAQAQRASQQPGPLPGSVPGAQPQPAVQQQASFPMHPDSAPSAQEPEMGTDLDDLIFNSEEPNEPPTSYRTEMSARHKTVRRADFTRPRIPQLDPKDADVIAAASGAQTPASPSGSRAPGRPKPKRSFFVRLKEFFAQLGSAWKKAFKDEE